MKHLIIVIYVHCYIYKWIGNLSVIKKSWRILHFQLGEAQLKGLLERVNEQTQKTTTVKVCRHKLYLIPPKKMRRFLMEFSRAAFNSGVCPEQMVELSGLVELPVVELKVAIVHIHIQYSLRSLGVILKILGKSSVHIFKYQNTRKYHTFIISVWQKAGSFRRLRRWLLIAETWVPWCYLSQIAAYMYRSLFVLWWMQLCPNH